MTNRLPPVGPTDEQLHQVISLYSAGQWADVELVCIKLTQEYPNHPFCWMILGVILNLTGRREAAIEPMRQAVKLSHYDAHAHDNLGIALYDLRRFEESVFSYKNALKILPDFAGALSNLGNALKELGLLKESEASYRKAIRIQPDYAQAYSNLGIVLKELGRLEEAESAYRDAIRIKPDFAEVHCYLGALLKHFGHLEASVGNYRKAIQIKPYFLDAYNNLRNALKDLGRLEELVDIYREAIRIHPDFAEAHHHLGLVLFELRQLRAAEASYREAIRINPNDFAAYIDLGNTLFELGRFEESESSYREAARINPDNAGAYINLGNLLRQLGRFEESEVNCREAIRINPDYPEAHINLGNALKELGRIKEAELSYREAIRIKPEDVEALINLGSTLKQLRCFTTAMNNFLEAIRIKPDSPEAHNNLGIVLYDLRRLEESVASLREAIRIKPDYADAHHNLGLALYDLCRIEESEASYREAIRIKPDSPKTHSAVLFIVSWLEKNSPEAYLDEAKKFGQLVKQNRKMKFSTWSFQPFPVRLRVGFVSGDLRNHPVGYFIEGLCKRLHSSRIELVAISTKNEEDELTARIKPLFQEWHSIEEMSDDQAAQVIHQAHLHVLIDLTGHTAPNRLGVFAYKPAPLQVTWLGYWASTGIEEMDYLLGDPVVTPEQDDHHFIEKVWRLPETRFCFTPPEVEIAIEVPPLFRNGYVTFGCFNNMAKLTPAVISVWSNIIRAVPLAKLYLKASQFADNSFASNMRTLFETAGVSPERLRLEGPSSRSEYLSAYNQIDIALDPFPYTGGTTSCEALWMGVPVLTLKGNTLISRQGEGILKNAGLYEWVANDKEDYVQKAIQFASDPDALILTKQNLRRKVIASPLFDAKQFASNFETTMFEMWNHHVDKINH